MNWETTSKISLQTQRARLINTSKRNSQNSPKPQRTSSNRSDPPLRNFHYPQEPKTRIHQALTTSRHYSALLHSWILDSPPRKPSESVNSSWKGSLETQKSVKQTQRKLTN